MSCHYKEYSSWSVNGTPCSYNKLGRYNNCSRAESTRIPNNIGDYVLKGAEPSPVQLTAAQSAGQNSIVSPTAVGADGAPVAVPVSNVALPNVGVKEGFYADSDYTPSYRVLNIPPINTNALTHGGKAVCGSYFNVMDAYSGMEGQSCVTNYINN